MKSFSITDVGRQRAVNQDCLFTSEKPVGPLPNLYLVADGMGGHKAGDVASRNAIEQAVQFIRASKETDDPARVMQDAISQANRAVLELAASNVDYSDMGTTFVAAVILDKKVMVANVGDSRMYLVGDGIRQISRDHSLVEDMVRRGQLDRESARFHPQKNIITRALGVRSVVAADFFEEPLKPGEMLLLCTDGLTNMLDDEEIRVIISQQPDMAGKVSKLVDAANANGGRDNITVVLVDPFGEEI